MPHVASFEYKTQNFMEKDKIFLLNKAAPCFGGALYYFTHLICRSSGA